ncbi:Dolichol-phosphate mannosyltransferase subunit 3 [Necator americanus]|uniref:Dolichol-phosphate mannosyltransferase subunit 3 n=1 Tax=Necator americanus TaxID=51031 RepID=W2SFQ4_NECAM|nr:Dolichol-phosphate mannosyltransferase subunit 3 [Necator americanus]ETN68348.1 Dolichol-phosphate mannosyltransferase subunit 3 [Necator americanus]
MVSQAVLYAAHVLPVGLLWLACVTGFFPLMKLGPDCDCFRHVVLYAPIYAVLLLGIYAMASVVHGVLTFNDCQAAREELVKEIKEAREDLKKRKII